MNMDVDEEFNANPNDIFEELQYLKKHEFVFNTKNKWDTGMWEKLEKLRMELISHYVNSSNSPRNEYFEIKNTCEIEHFKYQIKAILVRLATKIVHNLGSVGEEPRTLTPISDFDDWNNDQDLGLDENNNEDANFLNARRKFSKKTSSKFPKEPKLKIFDRNHPKNLKIDKYGTLQTVSKEVAHYRNMGLKQQAFMLHVISKVLPLVRDNIYWTKRELYYKSLEYCKTAKYKDITPGGPGDNSETATDRSSIASIRQKDKPMKATGHSEKPLNEMLDDLCCHIGCTKLNINILPMVKGIVHGDLRFELDSGVSIPNVKSAITKIESDAKFILVVEKDAVLQQLIDLKLTQKYSAILITGKGYPDSSTRAFLQHLWLKLNIPSLVLTDADPYGIEIACVYKFGSIGMAYESQNLAMPSLRWLGLLPTDLKNLNIPENECQRLTGGDIKKLKKLSGRPYMAIHKQWLDQVKFILEFGKKAQIESMDKICQNFLMDTYLPNKMRQGSWI
ncbi:Meiotic recombination protein SPO11, partial [Fragariocoptes setiger]